MLLHVRIVDVTGGPSKVLEEACGGVSEVRGDRQVGMGSDGFLHLSGGEGQGEGRMQFVMMGQVYFLVEERN